MFFQLYFFPVLLIIGAATLSYFLSFYIPEKLSGDAVFSSLVQASIKSGPWAGLILFVFSSCCAVISTYRLWRWYQGKCRACSSCGGILDYKVGRYGSYYKCLACGKNSEMQKTVKESAWY